MSRRRVLMPTAARWAVVLLIAARSALVAQQTGRIEGTVLAQETQRPLRGAQVSIQRTNLGTVTDEHGHYVLLNVPPGPYIVRARYLGYGAAQQSVTVEGGQITTLAFALTQSAVALDEVVVTGTAAAVRKKEVGNSTDMITAGEIANAPVANSEGALQGRVAGVAIMTNSGQPGSGGTIKIRGVNTITQSVQPLIYVDGVRIANDQHRAGWGGQSSTNPLQDINAEDIERMEVVKGAAATTLYGTEASTGVIQIFTKRGAAGAPIWNAVLSSGATLAPHFGSDDPTQFYTQCGDLARMYGIVPTGTGKGQRVYFQDPTCPASGHWEQPGALGALDVSVRGGTDRLTYYVSGNGSTTDGYLPTGNSKEGGFRGNFTLAPAEHLQFTLNTAYRRRDTRWIADGDNAAGFLLNVGRGPFGYMQGGKDRDCDGVPSGNVCVTNGHVFDAENFTKSNHFTTGFTVDYNPTEHFVHRFSVGWDYTDIYDETTRPFGHLVTPGGYYWPENTHHQKLSLDYAGSWRTTFGEGISSSFSWGGQLFRDRHESTEVDATTFAGPGRPTLESGPITYVRDRPFAGTNAGVFLQELLGVQDRLFITAGLRVDGNSAFGSNFGLQPYPKVSLAWVLSDYGFFPKDGLWETLKLRAALGQSGKAPGAFDRLRTWVPGLGDGEPGFVPDNVGNPDVGPERTTELEGGFDAGFLHGRLGLEFTAFRAQTRDALVPVNLPASLGFLNDQNQNVGTLRNEGLEAALHLAVLSTPSVDWRLRATASLLRSKVLELGPGSIDAPGAHMISTGNDSYMKVGYPAPAYFQYRIANPNAFADPVIVRDSLSYIGPVFPTRQLSIGTTLRLMNRLTLDALLEYQGGHYQENWTGYQSARRGAWFPCLEYQERFLNGGDISGYTAFERARCAPNGAKQPDGTNTYDFSWWIEKAAFWKLRSVSITYDLPGRLFPWANSASVTLAARNLLKFTGYTGTDPEVDTTADAFVNEVGDAGAFGRLDYYQIPPGRTVVLTLRTTF